MNSIFSIIGAILALMLLAVFFIRNFYMKRLLKVGGDIAELYRQKMDKIPALVETMRHHVAEKKALETIIWLHREGVLVPSKDFIDILEMNTRIQKEFLFLMKLSAHIPSLQTNTHFIYMRDFIIDAEKKIRSQFEALNDKIRDYNNFLSIKNVTLLGMIIPGKKYPSIHSSSWNERT